jgi:hypothetical protein
MVRSRCASWDRNVVRRSLFETSSLVVDRRGGPVPAPINFLHLDDIHPGIEAKLEYDPGACLPGAAGLVA